MPKKYKVRHTFTYNGKRYTVRADTEEEAIRKEQSKRDALQRGEVVIGSSMRLDDWAEKCIDTYKVRQKPRTRKNYKSHYRNLIGCLIGQKKLKDIKQLDCQSVLNEASGKSQYEINQAYQIMVFLFTHAVENGLINRSPAVGLVRPKGYRGERRALTDRELAAAERIFARTDRYLLFELTLYCGCRPAEASICRGSDLVEVDGYHCLHIRGTKSKAADRVVPVPDILYGRICDVDPFAPIAPDQNGHERSQTSRSRLWESFRYEMNLELGAEEVVSTYTSRDGKTRKRREIIGIHPFGDDMVPYNLRHTYCTRLMTEYDIDVRAAQYLMGHSDIQMVAHYTHPDHSVISSAAAQISPKSSAEDERVSHRVSHLRAKKG